MARRTLVTDIPGSKSSHPQSPRTNTEPVHLLKQLELASADSAWGCGAVTTEELPAAVLWKGTAWSPLTLLLSAVSAAHQPWHRGLWLQHRVVPASPPPALFIFAHFSAFRTY